MTTKLEGVTQMKKKCVAMLLAGGQGSRLYALTQNVAPFIFASIFLGLTLQRFITERETPFIIVVFSSIVFLFLSGLTWPRYAMSEPWLTISNLIPSTWGVEAFVRINSNGATLQQNATPFIMLWILCIIYFLTAIILGRKKDLVQNNS